MSGIHPVSDSELHTAIAAGGALRDKAIETIYNWSDLKEKINAYVVRHGGARTDGLDIFHDGIIALDKNIRHGKYREESGLEGYLYSICRFLWNNEWRRRMKTSSNELQDFQTEEDTVTPEVIVRTQEESKLLHDVLLLLDDSCRKILTLWKLSYSMIEIAEKMALSSPAMAKKYRYRCMQKLMQKLDQKPDLLMALKNV